MLVYKIPKRYDDKNYKVYRFIPTKNINLRVTFESRLSDLKTRIDHSKELEEIEEISIEDFETIEKEQAEFEKQIPFAVRYKDNFLWQIYHAKESGEYFTLTPMRDFDTARLSYLARREKASIYLCAD